MKVGIIIIAYNIDARIFRLQIDNIRRFCKDSSYYIEVIDNSSSIEATKGIKYHCKEKAVKYRRTISAFADGSESHAFAANLSYKILQDTYDFFLYLDHDCIPVKDFSVEEILGEKIIAGVRSGVNIPYFWPGCLMWNNNSIDKKMINFSPLQSLKLDTGGETYKIIEKYGEEKCIFLDEVGCQNPYFNNTPLYYFYMMIHEETFIHFLNSSGWNPTPGNEERLNSLINITEEKCRI